MTFGTTCDFKNRLNMRANAYLLLQQMPRELPAQSDGKSQNYNTHPQKSSALEAPGGNPV